MRLALRKAIAFIQQAHVKRTADDRYEVTIDRRRNIRELCASIYPLYCPAMEQALDGGIRFQGLEAQDAFGVLCTHGWSREEYHQDNDVGDALEKT